ncbi:hypothetical protein PMM47T1_16610 [Pseudomonas sp. M47T1]|uniref:hypothetical protein n=1 Tax=unclassified Pseudomonas TaxID=196821 RepID=UPI0002608860|nr:hypothetical protein [Pseudomonas sp. M47T1]EIK95429.1 hypothetical protein PMM47T1_16610 [Pseudomonas sp. M47T1]
MLRLVLLFLLQTFRRLFTGNSVSPRAELQGSHADSDEGRWTASAIMIICALVIYIIGGLGLYGKTHVWDTLTPAQKDFIVQSMITDQQVL